MSQVQESQANRLSNFKHKGKDMDEMRRRRSTATIELRKTNRFDQLLKKRNVAVPDASSPIDENNTSADVRSVMTIPEIMSAINSGDDNFTFQALQDARKILSRERFPPIYDIINSGVVPHLVEFLSDKYSESFQFEACWALTNIASGNSDETAVIVQAGAIPKLIQLLESPHKNVVEQAAWALGNIAGDGPNLRDQVIQQGALPILLKLLETDINISTVRNIVWTISNLCRNKNPPPPFHIVMTCLPTFYKLLNSKDTDVVTDTCWSLSYLTDGPDKRIQATVDAGVVPRVVELLSVNNVYDNCQILTPALRTIGNIVTGNDYQTDCVINAGGLPKLRDLLTVNRTNIVKEAAWSISNIVAGNSEQIQAVIDAGILPPLIQVLDTADFKSQKEAAWAVTNFTSGATIQQLSYILQLGVIPPMCNLLDAQDSKTVLVVMDGLSNILSNAKKVGELPRVAFMIEEWGGVDKLENLQNHENQQVYNKALSMIERYFSSEDDQGEIGPEEINGRYNFEAPEPTSHFDF
ncbi:hypothetical protein RUM44_000926 [Polyplax serrata]|uniref:Importin subunit alpha n=1 Tax=Polyplax serrata TaxID=468196 RepID=A0ABR1B7F9_POLSC